MNKLQLALEKHGIEIRSYLAEADSIAIALLDIDMQICDCNLGFLQFFNLQKAPLGEPVSNYLQLDTSVHRPGEHYTLPGSKKAGSNTINNCFLMLIENGYLLFCNRQTLRESRVLEQISQMNNELINLQRETTKKNLQLEKLKKELADRIEELEDAAARIKTLQGIIPICSYCKQIRDDKGYWNHLETYISKHSDALFSHGICDTCMDQMHGSDPQYQKMKAIKRK